MRRRVPPLTARSVQLAAAIAAGLCLAQPARAAEPCVKFSVDVMDGRGAELGEQSPGAKRVRRNMESDLERIRELAAKAFGEAGLSIAFECPRGMIVIGLAQGQVVTGQAEDRFEGDFSIAGNPWHPKLENRWELVFRVKNPECEFADDLIAISNALVDHRRTHRVAISGKTLHELGLYHERFCGIQGSESSRELRQRIRLLTPRRNPSDRSVTG